MTFRLPMALAFGAMFAMGCSGKPTDTSDTDSDVYADTDTNTVADTDVNDTDVQDTDLAQCDDSTDTDTSIHCGQCIACAAPVACPTELAACRADADCNNFFTCVTECGSDDSCLNTCAETYSTGAENASPVRDCVEPVCPNACR